MVPYALFERHTGNLAGSHNGGIVVRILHHVHQVHDGCIFVAIRLIREKAAWVHQAHDTEQLNLFT